MPLEACDKIRGRRIRCAGLVEHDDVEACEVGLVMPERFPDESLEAIASGCFATVLLGDGKTEPGEIRIIVSAKYGERLVATAEGPVEDATVGGRCQEPVAFREPVRVGAIQSSALLPVAAERRESRRVRASGERGLWRDGA